MTLSEGDNISERFVRHFFLLLNARNVSSAHGGGKEDRRNVAHEKQSVDPSVLDGEQRKALEDALPIWVRLLSASPQSGQHRVPTASRIHTEGERYSRCGSFLMDVVGDGWFGLPHLAPLPTPWAHAQPSRSTSRYRLLRRLQQRYRSAERSNFTNELLRGLEECAGTDKTIVLDDLIRVLDHLLTVPPNVVKIEAEDECKQLNDLQSGTEAPVVLLADVLFSEWCSVAEGDASFTSDSVPLHVVKADLEAFNKAGGCRGDGQEAAISSLAVDYSSSCSHAKIGTLAALACASPMTSATTKHADVKTPLSSGRLKQRARSDASDDEWEEDNSDDENVAEDARNVGLDEDSVEAFIARSTSVFDVPLASAVLSLYDVSNDAADDQRGVWAPRVVQAWPEKYYRRGQLQWFVVGESQRHRYLMQSKTKSN